MQFTSITVEDPEKAAAARDAYLAAARRSHSAMDRALARSYAALAEGRALLDLEATMRAVGVHEETKLPKLAVVRADFKEVFCRLEYRGTAIMAGTREFVMPRTKTRAGTARIEFPEKTFDRQNAKFSSLDVHRAPAPIIPPQCRPADAYRNYYILWEVARWEPVAPVDPLLLTHVTGPLYAVVAQWDLTEIERAVMNATLARGN